MQLLSRGRYLGLVEGHLECGSLTLVESTYSRYQTIPVHRHVNPYFCLVVDGAYEERCAASITSCKRDLVAFHPGGMIHQDRFGDSGGRCFNLEIDQAWLAGLDSGIERLTKSVYLSVFTPTWLMSRLRREARSSDRYAELSVDGLTRALVASVAREASAGWKEPIRGPEWLGVVVEMARREHAQGLGLSEAARRVGVHPRHLARTFRSAIGCSLGEFVRRERVETACRLLRESPDSVSRIAFQAGFADQSHLTRTMRRQLGLTPTEFRRKIRDSPSRSTPTP